MDVKQSYLDFLLQQDAKQKVKAIIEDGIRTWKGCQAYEYEACTDPYTGDCSGFIKENADALVAEYDIKPKKKWTEDDLYEYIDEAMYEHDYGLHEDWMLQEFPEYEYDEIDDEESYYAGGFIFQISGG